jgi:sialate O-acetylesterase
MKEPIGLRLAVYAARLRYGYGGEYTGPEPESATVLDYSKDTGDINKKVTTIELAMTHCAGLHIKALDKGDEIKDFLVVSYDGTVSDASASVSGEKIILQTSARAGSIREIRYLDSYTYKGAMIYNSAGFPMGPFVLTVGNH